MDVYDIVGLISIVGVVYFVVVLCVDSVDGREK